MRISGTSFSDQSPPEPKFPELVEGELGLARRQNNRFNSLHEAYAVLLEEVDELWDEVKKKQRDRKNEDVLAELVQVAAMAQRAAEDLNLV